MTKQTVPTEGDLRDQRRKSLDPMFSNRISVQRVAPPQKPPLVSRHPVAMDVHPTVPRRKALVPDTEQPVERLSERQSRQDSTTTSSPAVAPAEPVHTPIRKNRHVQGWKLRRTLLYGLAGILFVTGAAVSLYGLRANHQAEAQVKQGQQQTEDAVSDDVVPTTDKPSSATVKNYTVAPNLPKYLDIPNLKIHTRILSEGVTKSGKLQVPWNIYDTGWYNASAQPGQSGAMLIDGHSGIGKTHGVFHDLGALAVGDSIVVTRGDDRKFTYTVAGVQIVDVNKVNMSSMMVSTELSKPGLNLITCAGDVIPGTTELNKRVLVRAVLQ